MNIQRFDDLPDIFLLEPRIFEDARGYFFESFHQRRFEDAVGCSMQFVQDNHSLSKKGVLRGLHYQLPPKAQGKLIRVVSGEIFDVAVDVRRKSRSFGKWAGATLSANNKKQLWIPEGYAHGFLTLSNQAEVVYKTTEYYAPECERCIRWDDPNIGIKWPDTDTLILSEKDRDGAMLDEADTF